MLETRAFVVQVNGESALVLAAQAGGCEQCNGKGCGAGKLSQLFCSQPRQFQVDNTINASVGDEVVVSVADGAVLYGAGWVYLLPLLLLIAGALLGNMSAGRPEQGDIYAAVFGGVGLATGFILAKWVSSRRNGSRYRPRITRLWQAG